MSPKMHEYLFVYSEKDGSFPERLRVIDDAQSSEIPFAEKLMRTVDKADINERRAELERRYPAPEFRVATSWANKWGAVQRNYAGLDYEYDSPDGRGSGPPRAVSPPTTQFLMRTSADGKTKFVFLLGVIVFFGTAAVVWQEMAPHYGSVRGWALTLLHNPVYGAPSLILPVAFVAGVVTLYWFVYYMRIEVKVFTWGIELRPGRRSVPWDKVEHVWYAQRALRYSGVAHPTRKSLKLQIRGEGPIKLPHRFRVMDELVSNVLKHIGPVLLAKAQGRLRKDGSVSFGKHITVTSEHLTLPSLKVTLPLSQIGSVRVIGGTFQISNTDDKVIYSRLVELIPDAFIISPLLHEMKRPAGKSNQTADQNRGTGSAAPAWIPEKPVEAQEPSHAAPPAGINKAVKARRQPPKAKTPQNKEYHSKLVCPECSEKTLKIERSIELGSDSRSDECSLQAVRCKKCDFVGVAIYEESRRGAGESVNHFGYKMDSADHKAFLQELKRCKDRGNHECSCEAHEKYGTKNERGTLRPLEMVPHDKIVFPMKFH